MPTERETLYTILDAFLADAQVQQDETFLCTSLRSESSICLTCSSTFEETQAQGTINFQFEDKW